MPAHADGSPRGRRALAVNVDPTATPPGETPARPWLRWSILGVIAAALAVLFVLGPGGESDGQARRMERARPTPVSAAPVEVGPLSERATYPGELDADAAEVAANVTGRLVAVSVRIGDRVTRGQV